MNIRPKQGQVLVEMIQPDPNAPGLLLPDPLNKAKVLRLGMWPQAKSGALIPWEVKVGDTVIINPHVGQQLDGFPSRFKLVQHFQIDAVVD